MKICIVPILLSLTTGLCCGYRPAGALRHPSIQAVVVPTAGNFSSYSELAGPLTAAVRTQLVKTGVKVKAANESTPRLKLTILRVSGTPGTLGATGRRLTPLETVWQVHVEAVLTDHNDEIIEGPKQFSSNARAYSGGQILAQETMGLHQRQAVVTELAESIVVHFF